MSSHSEVILKLWKKVVFNFISYPAYKIRFVPVSITIPIHGIEFTYNVFGLSGKQNHKFV